MIYLKTCEVCKKTFETDLKYKAFCSPKCADTRTRDWKQYAPKTTRKAKNPTSRMCKNCMRRFTSSVTEVEFCSPLCRSEFEEMLDVLSEYDTNEEFSESKHPKRRCICPDCGTNFITIFPNKKYCSNKCRKHWEKNNNQVHKQGDKVIRAFQCKECKKDVWVTDTDDKRTDFCSNQCSRNYHRGAYLRHNRWSGGDGTLRRPLTMNQLRYKEWYTINR